MSLQLSLVNTKGQGGGRAKRSFFLAELRPLDPAKQDRIQHHFHLARGSRINSRYGWFAVTCSSVAVVTP